jgi:hypothetical protein
MKQTAVEQLGIAFREWQIEWDNYDGKKEPKPKSFDEFIKPFLEMEKQQIIDACQQGFYDGLDMAKTKKSKFKSAEQYYNETFNK